MVRRMDMQPQDDLPLSLLRRPVPVPPPVPPWSRGRRHRADRRRPRRLRPGRRPQLDLRARGRRTAASGSPARRRCATPSGVDAGHSMAPERRAVRRRRHPAPGRSRPAGRAHDVEARNTVRRYLGDLVKALPDVYPRAGRRQAGRRSSGVEDGYPELDMKPAFVQVPQVVLQNALDAARARDRRRRQGLPPDHRCVRAADRRAACRPSTRSATTPSGRARRSG